jgi:hypothetical protein
MMSHDVSTPPARVCAGVTSLLFCLLTASSLHAAAQTAATPQATESAHQTMIFSGCLEKPNAGAMIKLTNASRIDQPSPATSAGPKSEEYELTSEKGLASGGGANVDLDSHVGHKVEVTVRPPEVAQPPSTPETAAARPASAEPVKIKRFTVISLKQLASTCSASQ